MCPRLDPDQITSVADSQFCQLVRSKYCFRPLKQSQGKS